jgi:hypothetical protein
MIINSTMTFGKQGASIQFYIEVMEGFAEFWWQATPNFLFYYVQGR